MKIFNKRFFYLFFSFLLAFLPISIFRSTIYSNIGLGYVIIAGTVLITVCTTGLVLLIKNIGLLFDEGKKRLKNR